MSEPRDVEHVVGNPTASEMVETREAKKARIAQVLDRGMTNARLTVPLPNSLYGEWVLNDPIEIDRFRAMGFEKDTKYAINRGLHGSGGEAIVGDVVFMIAPIEVKEIMDELRADQYKRKHGDPKSETRLKQLEATPHGENELESGGVKIIDESEASVVNSEAIAQALKPQQ